MAGFAVRRALWAVVLLVAVSLITFVIFFVVPAEPTQIGRGAAANEISLREAYGLQEGSLPLEYARFVWEAVRHGSLGESFIDERPVMSILAAAIPVTASLVAGGVLLFLLIAVPIGIVSALRARSLLDRTAMLLVLVGISAHPVWIGLMLSYVFGSRLQLTPIGGYCDFIDGTTGCGGAIAWASHLLLPWLTFAILFAALYARMIRASVLETLHEDYVRTAHGKGAPRWLVLRSHVFRNAAIPVVAMLGMDVGLAFGGAVFIEQVYGLPGMGKLVLQGLARRDLPVIMGVVLAVTVAVVLFNLIVDILQAWLDPRTREATRSREVAAPEPDAPSRPARIGQARPVPRS